jgi:hypothetical protein
MKDNNLSNISSFYSGVFLFLPIAVNLFLIQHKESKRYLCGENNQLFGLVSKYKKDKTKFDEMSYFRPNEMNDNVYLKQNDLILILVDGIPIDFFMKVPIEVIYLFHIHVIQDYDVNLIMIII